MEYASMPSSEQDTVISYGRDQKSATIFTSDKTVMTKLDKLVEKSEHYTLEEVSTVDGGLVCGKRYKLDDKSLISFRSTKKTRIMSEEEKKAAAERMRRARGD